MRVCGSKRHSYHDVYIVSRCRIRGEFEDHYRRESTQAPRVWNLGQTSLNRPKQGYQWLHKKDLCHTKFKKKTTLCGSSTVTLITCWWVNISNIKNKFAIFPLMLCNESTGLKVKYKHNISTYQKKNYFSSQAKIQRCSRDVVITMYLQLFPHINS